MSPSLSEQLFHQFHQCGALLHRGRHRFAEDVDLPHPAQGRILSLLNGMDGISQRELTSILGLRPPSVSELVDKLQRAGLVNRFQNPDDKRLFNLSLTEEGKALVNRAEAARKTAAESLFSGLEPAEQTSLSTLLAKLIAALEEADTDHRRCAHDRRHGHGRDHAHEEKRHGFHGRRHGRGERDFPPHRHGRGPDGRPGFGEEDAPDGMHGRGHGHGHGGHAPRHGGRGPGGREADWPKESHGHPGEQAESNHERTRESMDARSVNIAEKTENTDASAMPHPQHTDRGEER